MSQRTEKLRRQMEYIKAQMDFDECRIGYLESEIAATQHNLEKVERDNKLRCRHTAHYVEELKEEMCAKSGVKFEWIAAALLLASIILLAASIMTLKAGGAELPMPEAEPQIGQADDGRLPGDDVPAAGYASEDAMPARSLGEFDVSYYCTEKYQHICGEGHGVTRSGTPVEAYVSCAVDSELIPLGSTVLVDFGDGVMHEYRADDTGGAICGKHIDLAVESHAEAIALGVTRATVWVEGVVCDN